MNRITYLKALAQEEGRLSLFEAHILFDTIDKLAAALEFYANVPYDDGRVPPWLSPELAVDRGHMAIQGLKAAGLWDATQEAGDE